MRLRARSGSVSTDFFKASATDGSAACSRRPQSGCASAILHPSHRPLKADLHSALTLSPPAGPRKHDLRRRLDIGTTRRRCRPRPGYFTASVRLRPAQLTISVIKPRRSPKRVAEKGHCLQRRSAARSTPALSNLQDAWKEFKIRRKEIKTSRNKSKSGGTKSKPGGTKSKSTSFHESSLFNGLSPTLTGMPGKAGADAHSPRREQTVNFRLTRLSRKC